MNSCRPNLFSSKPFAPATTSFFKRILLVSFDDSQLIDYICGLAHDIDVNMQLNEKAIRCNH